MNSQINPEGIPGIFDKRIITAKELAAGLRRSVHWVYLQTKDDCKDQPPRGQGRTLIFDTWYVPFQEWVSRKLGHVPLTQNNQTAASSIDSYGRQG
jgi:hypothetical protein